MNPIDCLIDLFEQLQRLKPIFYSNNKMDHQDPRYQEEAKKLCQLLSLFSDLDAKDFQKKIAELEKQLEEAKKATENAAENAVAKAESDKSPEAIADAKAKVKTMETKTQELQKKIAELEKQLEEARKATEKAAEEVVANRPENDSKYEKLLKENADLKKQLDDAKKAEAKKAVEKAAEDAVAKAESDKSPEAIADAKAKVNALENGAKKDELLKRIAELEKQLDNAKKAEAIKEKLGEIQFRCEQMLHPLPEFLKPPKEFYQKENRWKLSYYRDLPAVKQRSQNKDPLMDSLVRSPSKGYFVSILEQQDVLDIPKMKQKLENYLQTSDHPHYLEFREILQEESSKQNRSLIEPNPEEELPDLENTNTDEDETGGIE